MADLTLVAAREPYFAIIYSCPVSTITDATHGRATGGVEVAAPEPPVEHDDHAFCNYEAGSREYWVSSAAHIEAG